MPCSLKSLHFLGILFFILLSCSETPEQYQADYQADFSIYRDGIDPKTPFLVTEPSQPEGGLLLYQKELTQTEATKSVSTREKSLVPIDYQTGSAAGISLETTYEEAQGILNFNFLTSSGLSVYKEGVAVAWREDAPRTPHVIFVITNYQGTMDFGPEIGGGGGGTGIYEWGNLLPINSVSGKKTRISYKIQKPVILLHPFINIWKTQRKTASKPSPAPFPSIRKEIIFYFNFQK